MLKSLTFPCNPSPNPIANPRQSQMMMVLRCRAGAQSLAEPNNLIRNSKRATFYDVLRVNQTASSVEIKAAYRSLAKLYHPDAATDSHSRSHSHSDGHLFMEIHNAYETLSDPTARSLYDLSLGFAPDSHRRSPFGLYSVARRPTRRWETDQCW